MASYSNDLDISTSRLWGHYTNPIGYHNLDIYFNHELLGTNANMTSNVRETVYWEYDTQVITQQQLADGSWYPSTASGVTQDRPTITESGNIVRLNGMILLDGSLDDPNHYASNEINIPEQIGHGTSIFFVREEVVTQPWTETAANGTVYTYRQVKGIYREIGYQRDFIRTGSFSHTAHIRLAMYSTLVYEQRVSRFEVILSEYMYISPDREIYTDFNTFVDFTLTNTNRGLKDVYVELVRADNFEVIIPRKDITDTNFTVLETSLSWHSDGETDGESSSLQRLYEYMADKTECKCYIRVSYRTQTAVEYTRVRAEIIVRLGEVHYGYEDALWPEVVGNVRDINPTTNALTGHEKRLVRYYSNVEATMTATGMKGASIVLQRILTDNASIDATSYLFEGITDGKISFYAKDSRGYTRTVRDSLAVFLEYVRPTCNITDIGLPTVDDTCRIVLSGMYWDDNFGAVHNQLTLWYRYKSTILSEFTDWIQIKNPQIDYLQSGRDYNAVVDVDLPNHIDRFTLQVMAKDKLTFGESQERSVRAFPIFDWGEHDFNFNIPVNINGDLTVSGTITSNTPVEQQIEPADYIIEQGTRQTGSGNSLANWTFRKWNSGIYECWCRKHIQTAVNTAWGNLYVSGSLAHTNLIWPGAFIDIPVANITIAPNASGAFLIASGSTSLSATLTGGYEIARGSALASAGNFYINYYGIGRWK